MLPRRCLVCASWGGTALCPACVQRFAAPRSRCPRCAEPTPGHQVCGRCLRQPPAFCALRAAVDYAFPWDGLLQRLKFHDQPELAAALADLLSAVLADGAGDAAQAVLPVPLSRQRLAGRGFNQAWELARRVARARRLPAHADLLQRLRDTPHQVGLSRAQRADNLRDAFWLPPAARPVVRGRHLALVDDVLTTGMTAQVAGEVLLAAGAASVQVWVVARTPAPSED